MKTATIKTYHVIGTRGTNAARVLYRGRVLYEIIGNCSRTWLAARAVHACVALWGFTHASVDGDTRRAVCQSVGEGLKPDARARYHIGIGLTDEERAAGVARSYTYGL